ncbi:MAG: sigma-70 family RNA polymerase sigma factor [Armatimonadota bacterium]
MKGNASNADDLRLVLKAQRGDREAMDALVSRYQNLAYQYAWRLSRDSDEAADVVAEAFARVYAGIDRFRKESRFSTWLYRIIVNCYLDMRKREARHQHASIEAEVELDEGEVGKQFASDQAGPDAAAEGNLRGALLARAIAGLPEAHRVMIIMYHVEMLGYEEIAAALGVPVGTVKSRLNRARLALKEVLAPHMELFCG